jgi:hypothetical protein
MKRNTSVLKLSASALKQQKLSWLDCVLPWHSYRVASYLRVSHRGRDPASQPLEYSKQFCRHCGNGLQQQ